MTGLRELGDEVVEHAHGHAAAPGHHERAGEVEPDLGAAVRALDGGEGVFQMAAGGHGVAASQLGAPERDEQLRAIAGRRLGQRTPQVRGGVGRPSVVEGVAGGVAQDRDGLRDRCGLGTRVHEVACEGLRRQPVAGQPLGGVRVGVGAVGRCHARVDRIADDRMHKAPAGVREQDAVVGERARRLERGGLLEARERGRVAQLGARPQDGDGTRERDPVGAAALNPRQLVDGDRRGARGRGVLAGAKRVQQRPQEERIAAAGGVAGRGIGRGAIPVAQRHDELGRRGGRQRLRSQQPGHGRRGDRRQQLGLRRWLAGAACEHDDHRELAEPAQQVVHEAQRRRVGPLHVVDRQQQDVIAGEARAQPVQALQQSVLTGLRRRLGGRIEERGGHPRRTGEQRLALVVGRGDEPRLEELADDREVEGLLERARLGMERCATSAAAGALAGVGEQRGLADARRALEQHDAARAAAGGRERGVELRDLVGALEQFRCAVTPFSIDPVDHRFAPRWVPVRQPSQSLV